MDILDVIHTRHSVSRVLPDPVPPGLIQTLLSAAVQAPNHFRVRPWRFFVISGDSRVRLGEVMAQSLRARQPASDESALAAERSRPLRAPVLIAVAVDPPAEPKVVEIENICAAAAAVENMLLAAHALGLGAMWRTGPAARDPKVKAFLGIAAEQELIAFVYVGYPDEMPVQPPRPSYEDRVVWME
ncbi:MAG: nitroreductase [Anaerolineaceae bacterium]|nr:nitroreductase [Anaerolineaceae bacterium]